MIDKTKETALWIATALFVLLFVLVVLGLVRTMNANDSQFGPPPTTTGASNG